MAKKEEKKSFAEDPEVLQEKFVSFELWAEKNARLLISVAAGVVIVAGAYFGYRWWIGNQNQLAQQEMFQAIRYFESDSLDLAMNGTANSAGFKTIIDEYGGTEAANLAHFYAGAISLKKGDFPLAIYYLKEYQSSDLLIQPRAYALLGDAYMEQDNFADAADAYHKASNYKPNKYFTPMYLLKEALAYEKLSDSGKAMAAYERILKEFWDSEEAQNAKKYKARLESAS